MGLLKSIYTFIYYKICGGNHIRIIGDGKLELDSTVILRHCSIIINPNAKLKIGRDAKLIKSNIYINDGRCDIENDCIFDNTNISIEKGAMDIGHHCKIACKRIWVRFGGVVSVGDYTNINQGSEIRCDEKVAIGSYNQISYNVRIWDSNTHNILPGPERRKLTQKHFPYFGWEDSRPETKPVFIGNDCWIGENAVVMKGSSIDDESIVGFGTMIIGKAIPKHSRVVNERILRITSL